MTLTGNGDDEYHLYDNHNVIDYFQSDFISCFVMKILEHVANPFHPVEDEDQTAGMLWFQKYILA